MGLLDPADIEALIDQLLTASTQAGAHRVLTRYRWLCSPPALHQLRQMIDSKRQARDLNGLLRLLVGYNLITQCQKQGVDRALTHQPGWPLITYSPLLQLLRLPASTPAEEQLKVARLALDEVEPTVAPDIVGLIHYNLGLGYQARLDAGHFEAIAPAIQHFEAAVQGWTSNNSLFGNRFIGRAQDNLGRLYLKRLGANRSREVETAIDWLEQAHRTLPSHLPDGRPEPARITLLNLLADAHLQRLVGERLENIEQAIQYLTEAQQLATNVQDGAAPANIEHDLAVTYRRRLRGSQAENIEQAISYAEQARRRLNPQTQATAWARTTAELATIYGLRQQGDRADNLEDAIAYVEQALTVYQPQTHWRQWVLAQLTRGNLYCDRLKGDRAQNEQTAIACFEQVLAHCPRETDPLRWAEAQNNLGTIYAARSRRPGDADYQRATECFRLVMEESRPEILPEPARRTALNWGQLALRLEEWSTALEQFQTALVAGETLFAASGTAAGRRAELAENAGLAAGAAYCLLKLGQPAEALLQLDRGKTRLLAEALALTGADLEQLPPVQRQAVTQGRQTIRQLEAELQLLDHSGLGEAEDSFAKHQRERQLSQELIRARAGLNQQIKEIRAENPGFMPTGLELAELLALVPAGGALVVPLITAQGSAVWVVPDDTLTVTSRHVLWLDNLTGDTLRALLVGSESDPGWLAVYITYRTNPQANEAAWYSRIESTGQQVWQLLVGPIVERLVAVGITPGAPVLLMPQGGLGLLPLHAAWREVNGAKRTLLDDYTVTYAPSGYALHVSQRRLQEESRQQTSLLAVVNPTKDLTYTPIEGEQVVKLFGADKAATLQEDKATPEAVVEAAAGRSYLHFSCHGFYNWGDAMLSGLVLARRQPLTLADIIGKLDLDTARLVVMSACETGLTEFRQSPDEYVGLPAGFLQAGAPGVVSTLWAVDDLSTMLLMERFYQCHLKDEMEPAAALRQAQLWLRDVTAAELRARFREERLAYMGVRMPATVVNQQYRRFALMKENERPFAQPYYWAAFTFSGA